MNFPFPILRTWCAALSLAAGLLLPMAVQAQAPGEAKPLDIQALTTIVENATGAKVESIAPAPLAGLYEVILNGNVAYIDATGRYLVDGHLIDVATRSSITARRKVEHEMATTPLMEVARLDLSDAIKTVYGKEVPGRFLVSFEDPRCPFCKRMHKTLKDVQDVVLYTFPVSYLGPESRAMNEIIWCAKDRSASWNDAMTDVPPADEGRTCDLQALERNTALATRYRVTGTPTMFTASGVRIAGAVAAPAIEQALTEAMK